MKKWMVAGLFVILVAGLAAEDFFTIRKRIVDSSWKRILGIYVSPTLVLQDLGYTDNIYSYDNNPVPDFRVDIGADITLSTVIGNRLIISLNERPFYSYYAERSEQRAFNHSLQISGHTWLGGLLDLHYHFTEQSIKQRPTQEYGIPIRVFSTVHRLAAELGRQDGFFATLSVEENDQNYEDDRYLGVYDLPYRMDHREMKIALNLQKRVFTRTGLFLGYEYYEKDFSILGSRNGQGNVLFAGLRFPEISSVRGQLRLGVKNFLPDEEAYESFLKPFGRGALDVMFLGKYRLSLNYLVDYSYSFWGEDIYFDNRSLGAGVQWYVSRKIRLGVHQQIGRLTYRSLTGGDAMRRDDILSTRASLAVRVNRRMGVGIQYTAYRAASDYLEFDRSYHFFGGFVTHDF